MPLLMWIVLAVAVAIVVGAVLVVQGRSSGGTTTAEAVRRGASGAEAEAYLTHVRRDNTGSSF